MRRTRAIIAASALALTVTACGGGNGGTAPTPAEPSAEIIEETVGSDADPEMSDSDAEEIAPGVSGTDGVKVEGKTTDEDGNVEIDKIEVGEGESVTFE